MIDSNKNEMYKEFFVFMGSGRISVEDTLVYIIGHERHVANEKNSLKLASHDMNG